MTEPGEPFDDDALEAQNAAEGLIGSIKPYLGQRCCVHLDSEVADDTCHGKLISLIKDWPAILVRDLTPGRERLQRKRLIPLEVIQDMCFSPNLEKCKGCPDMKALVEDGGTEEKPDAAVDA